MDVSSPHTDDSFRVSYWFCPRGIASPSASGIPSTFTPGDTGKMSSHRNESHVLVDMHWVGHASLKPLSLGPPECSASFLFPKGHRGSCRRGVSRLEEPGLVPENSRPLVSSGHRALEELCWRTWNGAWFLSFLTDRQVPRGRQVGWSPGKSQYYCPSSKGSSWQKPALLRRT